MGNGTQVMTQVTTQVIRIGIEGRYAARNNTCAGDEPAPVSAWNGSVFELFLPIIICASNNNMCFKITAGDKEWNRQQLTANTPMHFPNL